MAEYIEKKDAIEATCFNCSEKKICDGSCDDTDRLRLIPAADVVPASVFRDCRNELCLKCGAYTQKHNGACDGCRWRENDEKTYGISR